MEANADEDLSFAALSAAPYGGCITTLLPILEGAITSGDTLIKSIKCETDRTLAENGIRDMEATME